MTQTVWGVLRRKTTPGEGFSREEGREGVDRPAWHPGGTRGEGPNCRPPGRHRGEVAGRGLGEGCQKSEGRKPTGSGGGGGGPRWGGGGVTGGVRKPGFGADGKWCGERKKQMGMRLCEHSFSAQIILQPSGQPRPSVEQAPMRQTGTGRTCDRPKPFLPQA